MDAVDEDLNIQLLLEEGEIYVGKDVLNGGEDAVVEDGFEVSGEAAESAEEMFEIGQGFQEFVGGCREDGAMDEFVYLVYEIVKGDLVFAGGAGFFMEGQCTVFVSLF
jgi:hypothetical protein